MDVLAPIDGSECSFRALEFAIEFAERYEATLHVIHITDFEGEGTNDVIDRAKEKLADAGVETVPEIETNLSMSTPGYANRVGKDIVQIVDEEGHDHVVMGHHGTGRVGRIILGSAAETVLRATDVPATIIP
jgi:nucleotide-binding universal stress UspA family protein